MAILIPITAPIALQIDGGEYGLAMILTLASILDGAILGDHCSPISDTTIMSSISSSCDHIDHVKTQMPYCLLVGSCALLLGYLPSALGVSPWISLVVGIGALFFILQKWGSSPTAAIGNNNKAPHSKERGTPKGKNRSIAIARIAIAISSTITVLIDAIHGIAIAEVGMSSRCKKAKERDH